MPVDKIDREAERYAVHRQFYGNRWPKFQKLAQKKKVWFLPILLVTIRLVVTHHFSYVQRIRAPFFAANDFLEYWIQNYCRFSSTSNSAMAFQIESRDHTEIPVQSTIKGVIY